MKQSSRLPAFIGAGLLATCIASAQVIVYFPDSATTTGATNTQPFGTSQATNGYTNIHFYPAATLAAQGAMHCSQLVDLAIVPASGTTGTFSSTNFRYYVGHVIGAPVTTGWLSNITSPVTLWDTVSDGTFTFPWTIDTWTSLPIASSTAPFIWDGIHDIAVMFVNCPGFTGGFSLRTAPGNPYVRYGVVACNPAPGTPTGTTGVLGCRLRLTFSNATCFTLTALTAGGGNGDLLLGLTNVPAGTSEGFTLLSSTATGPIGQGPFLGLEADGLTFAVVTSPAAPGNPLHWLTGFPGLFPDVPLGFPAGTLSFLGGTSWDAVAVALGPGLVYLDRSAVVRLFW